MKTRIIIAFVIAALTTANSVNASAQNRNISENPGSNTVSGDVPIERIIGELKNENKKLNKKNTELENRLNQMEKDLSQCCMNYQSAEGSSSKQLTNVNYSDVARLEQNTPNPFKEKTVIRYYVPSQASSAFIKIYSLFGSELLSFPLASKGFNQIEFSGKTLSAGIFTYILIVDEKAVDTKQMVLTK